MTDFEFWHHHGGISVPDLDAAIQWWERVMGFRLLRKAHIPSVPCEMAMVANGNLHMELFEVPGAQQAPYDRSYPDHDLKTYGNKHVSFAVREVDAFAEELRRRGADIVWVKHFPNNRANIFIRDPFGNLIEFVQEPKPEVQPSAL
jgi:methylmalonyl-CoA/ethylmalonyl-CoA epimerase